MARHCTVCQHEARRQIDVALVRRRPLAAIARDSAVSEDALARHRDRHVPEAVRATEVAQQAAHGLDLLAEVQTLYGHAMSRLARADDKHADKFILAALACLDRLDRFLDREVLERAEWRTICAALFDALVEHDDAAAAMCEALSDRGADGMAEDLRALLNGRPVHVIAERGSQ